MDTVLLETRRGPVVMRPEQPSDADFLYALFRVDAIADLAEAPIDDATKEGLVRMQFNSRNASYRAQYPTARFDIIERDGVPIGRFIVHDSDDEAYFVDFALLPEHRRGGLGAAITAAMMARHSRGTRPVRVLVLYTNEISLHMCDRLGFVDVGGEPPYRRLEWRPPASDSNLKSEIPN
jgi:RimJ/RimL family protein N-acetyltransferase